MRSFVGETNVSPLRLRRTVDGGRGQVGEIAEGFVEDLVALAVGAAEEVGVVDAAFVPARYGGYMNRTASRWHVAILAGRMAAVNSTLRNLLATFGNRKRR